MTTQIAKPTWFRPYVVMHSAAKMPSSVRSPYRNIAILKTDGARVPQIIRACLGAEIIYHSGPLHAGGTKCDAFDRALARAEAECRTLNDACEIERMTAIRVSAWRISEVRAAQ